MDKTFKAIPGLFVGCLIAAILCFSLSGGCQSESTARRVLSEQGYTDIELTGWRPFMAGKDDTFSTGFRAKSPSGKIVTGAVTSGFVKGSTIRFD